VPLTTYCIEDINCQTFDKDVCFERSTMYITYTLSCGYILPWLGGSDEECELSIIIRIDVRYRVTLEIEFSNHGPSGTVITSDECRQSHIFIYKTSKGTQLLIRLCDANTRYNGTVYSDWNTMLLSMSKFRDVEYPIIIYAVYRSSALNTVVIKSE
jgi:hypothetical protein